MKRTLALVLSVLMLLSLLAACGGSGTESENTVPATDAVDTAEVDTDTAETTAEDEPKVFVYGSTSNSTTFDPMADLQTGSGLTLLRAVCETLWSVNKSGELLPKLAESVEWTGDLELTITLPAGVTFSNGNALTSDDVLYTLEHMRDTDKTANNVSAIDFEATTCPDDQTIVIEFTSFDNGFIECMSTASCGILDRETCEAYEESGSWSWLIGTGPYKLQGDGIDDVSGWEESVQYTLVRNENYYGDKPYYDEIIIKFYNEESTRYSDFQAGNLDAIFITESTYVNSLNDGEVSDAHLVQRSIDTVFGFALAATDATRGTMSDINVRKAFAHALDIPTMVESIGEGIYTVASSVVGEGSWVYENVGTYEYAPELAAEYLAEAGYSVDNPLTIELVAEDTAFAHAIAEASQSYLAEIGINLDVSGLGEFSSILPLLLENQMDVTISGSKNGGIDPDTLLNLFNPESNSAMTRSVDPELVDLFVRGASSQDQDERLEIYTQIQEIIHDQYLFVPMWCETKNYGVKDTHAGFENALGSDDQLDPTLLVD